MVKANFYTTVYTTVYQIGYGIVLEKDQTFLTQQLPLIEFYRNQAKYHTNAKLQCIVCTQLMLAFPLLETIT